MTYNPKAIEIRSVFNSVSEEYIEYVKARDKANLEVLADYLASFRVGVYSENLLLRPREYPMVELIAVAYTDLAFDQIISGFLAPTIKTDSVCFTSRGGNLPRLANKKMDYATNLRPDNMYFGFIQPSDFKIVFTNNERFSDKYNNI